MPDEAHSPDGADVPKSQVSHCYLNDPISAEHREHGFAGVVAKPYQFEQPATILRKVIERARA